MSDYNWQTVETIIDEVLALPVEKREEYIRERCKGNDELKNEVNLLLASINESEGWLENPEKYKEGLFEEASDDLASLPTDHITTGSKIGSYIIKEKIGEGGMGSVYRAEREGKDFTHEVAVKIIQKHRATKENIQRFRREQQILANLKHTGVARLYDGGLTEEGFPFIIMEYVDGSPITAYCREQNCSVKEKIELFKKVLSAVQYAHENLTIHRDLKPDNILVDRHGNVKILDFGISKLLEDDDIDLTRTNAQVLTLRYASPEQIKNGVITTASDIYSLGIILYKLLTGKEPFKLDKLTRYQVEKVIVEKEPPTPSSIVEGGLKTKLKGDIDAILMKAIRKEPESRYRTANDFINDLNHYFEGLPVTAREDSFRYRANKFMRRHKQGVAVFSGIVLLISALVGFYTWRITQERNQAQLEAEKARQVTEYIKEIFRVNDPTEAQIEARDLNAIQLLNNGLERVNRLQSQPAIQSELMIVISDVFYGIGEYQTADSLLQASLIIQKQLYGESSPQTAKTYHNLGIVKRKLGHLDQAIEHGEIALNLFKKASGTDNTLLANVTAELGSNYEEKGNADKALTLFNESLSYYYKNNRTISRLDNQNIASTSRSLGRLLAKQGENQRAEELLQNTYRINKDFFGDEDLKVAYSANDLGTFYMNINEYEESYPLFEESIRIKKKFLEENHPSFASTYNNMAVLQEKMGNFSVAESLYNKTLSLVKVVFGQRHPATVATLSNMGSLERRRGNFARSESLYTEVLKLDQQIFGDQHRYIGTDLYNIAIIKHLTGNLYTADSLFNESASILKATLPPSHPDLIKTLIDHGKLALDLEDSQKATQLLTECLERLEGSDNARHSEYIEAYTYLALSTMKNKDFTSAERYFLEAQSRIDSVDFTDEKLIAIIQENLETIQGL
ncbi:serine/threonine-protein kinase [Gracilimonas sp. BCB1]|uniref:serine/threonine-protein kinase n=1 Tax=Gracilimonas sp. BCB1 TaxID=3152362 RepID=UPI0032D9A330